MAGAGLSESEQCHRQYAETDYCVKCATLGCLGGSLCATGYEGDACSSCVEGYYAMPVQGGTKSECLPCPDSAWVTVVFLLFGFFCVCYFVYHYGHNTSTFASFGVIITHFQLVSSFTLFQIPWPSVFADFTKWLGAVFTFNLQFVAHPECAAKMGHLEKWLLFLCSPLLFIGAFMGWYALCVARNRTRSRRTLSPEHLNAPLHVTALCMTREISLLLL